jgi:hypothetical protein
VLCDVRDVLPALGVVELVTGGGMAGESQTDRPG